MKHPPGSTPPRPPGRSRLRRGRRQRETRQHGAGIVLIAAGLLLIYLSLL